MNKIFSKIIIFLFLLTSSAYSTTLVDSDGQSFEVNQQDVVPLSHLGEIPEGEQYMVDRALQQNPNLSRDDISRIEFEAGTYYGQINSRGVPNGYGILGVGDAAMETNFKNGKISRGAEPTIVSSTGEVVTETDAVDFQNRAFNNGFDVSVVMSNVLENLDMNYVVDEFVAVSRVIVRNNWESDIGVHVDILRDLLTMEGERNEEQQAALENALRRIHNRIYETMASIEAEINFHQMFFRDWTLVEMLVLYSSNSDTVVRIRDLQEDLARLENSLFTHDILWQIGAFTNGNTVSYVDAIHALGQIYYQQPEDGLPELTDIRIYSNVNLRRNTVGDTVIEGEFNGQFYEMEFNGSPSRLTLSEQGRREFNRDQSGDKGGEGGESGGDGM